MSTTTDTPETAGLAATVDAYLVALTEADPARRAELVERAWGEDCRFIDPLLDAEGRAAVAGLADTILAQFPGHSFRRTTGIDAHHGLVRFGWEAVGPDGAVVLAGLDVGIVGPDGRLQRVAGFYGDPPPVEAAA